MSARNSAVRLLLAFCQRLGLNYRHLSYIHVCWYVEYLARHNANPASISNAISHIRTFFTLVGLSLAPLKHIRVFLALRALPITMRHTPNPKDPVTPQLLKEALANAHRLPNPKPVKLALLLMFMGFLRQSTVAPYSVKGFDPTRHLTTQDLTITPTGLRVAVKWTKTIQSSANATCVLLPSTRDTTICPVTAYRALMEADTPHRPPTAPLLRHRDGNPMTVPYLRRQWALLLGMIGKSPTIYSLHSLRRGAAQYSYNDARAQLNDVMLQGTWKSQAVRAYIRPNQEQHNSVHRALRRL